MPSPNNPYTEMQKTVYSHQASQWSLSNRDPVVGTFDAHNNWSDYEFLFTGLTDLSQKTAIDFGCGPGRNLVTFGNRFQRLDGVDLSETNLTNAMRWLLENGRDASSSTLYLCNGVDLSGVPSDTYDVLMSTITFQHICVHEIRYGYLREFFRVLKPGGVITIQMGYGTPSPLTVDYHANNYGATSTNRGCDTEVKDASQLENDLTSVGFTNFSYVLRPPGPGDCHPQWIFFQATKPV